MSSDCSIKVIKADDVARMLGVSKQTVYTAARAGELPCRRLGRRYVFVESHIEDWLKAADAQPSSAARRKS